MKQRRSSSVLSNRWFWIPLGVVALAGVYLAASNSTEAPDPPLRSHPPAEESAQAPAFSLPTLDGGKASLSQFKGKVVILDFWASWCPPCKREIPDFVQLQKKYGPQGLQVVGVALDEIDPVRDFAAQAGINYPVLIGNAGVARLYGGVSGIPTTFVINRAGRIVKQYVGYRPRQVFEQDITSLL